ncbi:hypothetical protein ACVWW6_006059 [Bradyrhizobium sp. USDA 3311]
MAYKWQFGSKARERLYSREAFKAYQAGRGEHPICVHCDLPVTPDQAWDRSHIDVPACFGGNCVGVGHRKCNQRDNNEVVTPLAAKANEVRKRHLGIKGPGLGRHSMRCGRRSKQKAKIGGGVVPRLTLAQQLRALNEKRYGFVRGAEQ